MADSQTIWPKEPILRQIICHVTPWASNRCAIAYKKSQVIIINSILKKGVFLLIQNSKRPVCYLFISVFIVSCLVGVWIVDLAASKPIDANAGLDLSGTRIGQIQSISLPSEVLGAEKSIKARLAVVSKHTSIWVDGDVEIPKEKLLDLIKGFEKQIYPNNLKYFAVDRGVRNKASRINILITDLGGTDGYFNPAGIKNKLIYINGDAVDKDSSLAKNTLAHEFEHMLFKLSGGGDVQWLDEGLAVWAEYINDGRPTVYVESWRDMPNVGLTDRGEFLTTSESYGAAFVFTAFAASQAQKSGHRVDKFFQALIKASRSGGKGIDSTLVRFIDNHRFNSIREILSGRSQAYLVDFSRELFKTDLFGQQI